MSANALRVEGCSESGEGGQLASCHQKQKITACGSSYRDRILLQELPQAAIF
ncbi:hypothetical protein A9HBioS_4832 [Pseudomonas koreensis]|uniref:Uncharacterized protein n=1 Tax=Pseudomonas koreensis TaxID=198620 RepID=A0AA94EJ86_9PSED|nr:hypothetical protein A9HBioS_4832 [Pseudomonas koreensis]